MQLINKIEIVPCDRWLSCFRFPSIEHGLSIVRKRVIDTYTYTQNLTELTRLHEIEIRFVFPRIRETSDAKPANPAISRPENRGIEDRFGDFTSERERVSFPFFTLPLPYVSHSFVCSRVVDNSILHCRTIECHAHALLLFSREASRSVQRELDYRRACIKIIPYLPRDIVDRCPLVAVPSTVSWVFSPSRWSIGTRDSPLVSRIFFLCDIYNKSPCVPCESQIRLTRKSCDFSWSASRAPIGTPMECPSEEVHLLAFVVKWITNVRRCVSWGMLVVRWDAAEENNGAAWFSSREMRSR